MAVFLLRNLLKINLLYIFAEELRKRRSGTSFFDCIGVNIMEIKEKVIQILQNHLENDKYFIVEVKVSLSKVHSKVLILIDSDAGISIDECSTISRKIGLELDELMPEKYTLEVSSPGVDVPLKTERMYRKNIGRSLKVVLKDGKELKGLFQGIENGQISLIEDKKRKKGEEIVPLIISLEEIKESKVIVSFK